MSVLNTVSWHFGNDKSETDFFMGMSASKSLPPLTLSAKYTFPVVATATI